MLITSFVKTAKVNNESRSSLISKVSLKSNTTKNENIVSENVKKKHYHRYYTRTQAKMLNSLKNENGFQTKRHDVELDSSTVWAWILKLFFK